MQVTAASIEHHEKGIFGELMPVAGFPERG